MLRYHAAYSSIEDGWYLAEVLDFPGVVTQGKNMTEARHMVRDALRLMAECYLEAGKPLPKPNPSARKKTAKRIEPVFVTVPSPRREASKAT